MKLLAMATGGFGVYEIFLPRKILFWGGKMYFFYPTKMPNVTVRVEDIMGCETTFTNTILKFTGMLEVPNFLHPNGDNMNDEWYPLEIGIIFQI